MRNGVLVEEGSPRYILSKYGTESLESAFLTICSDQEINKVKTKISSHLLTYL